MTKEEIVTHVCKDKNRYAGTLADSCEFVAMLIARMSSSESDLLDGIQILTRGIRELACEEFTKQQRRSRGTA